MYVCMFFLSKWVMLQISQSVYEEAKTPINLQISQSVCKEINILETDQIFCLVFFAKNARGETFAKIS